MRKRLLPALLLLAACAPQVAKPQPSLPPITTPAPDPKPALPACKTVKITLITDKNQLDIQPVKPGSRPMIRATKNGKYIPAFNGEAGGAFAGYLLQDPNPELFVIEEDGPAGWTACQ